MSQDRHTADSTEQVGEQRSGEAEPVQAPVEDNAQANTDQQRQSTSPIDGAQPIDEDTKPDFKSFTIRSYLAKHFGAGEVTTPIQPTAPVVPPTDAEAELAKWHARVPKLASALKERTAQVKALEAEVVRLQTTASNEAEAILQERDDHIAALGIELQRLTDTYRASKGNLRAREEEVENLGTVLLASKQRWQNMSEALGTQVLNTGQAQALLQAAMDRDEANQTQLEAQQVKLATSDAALGEAQQALALLAEQLEERTDTLQQVQAQLVSQAQGSTAKLAEQKQLNLLETVEIQAEHSERLRDIHAQTLLVFDALEQQNVEEQRHGIAAMQSLLEQKFHAQELVLHNDYAQLQQAAGGLWQQVGRLQTQVTQQQLARTEADAQYASDKLRDANAHQHALANVTLALEAQVQVLENQLHEQAQELCISVLDGISDNDAAHREFAQAWHNLDGNSVDATNATILELERLLKIRNDELKAAVAARVHFLPAVAAAKAQSQAQATGTADTIASLQAQINSERDENERLSRQLERANTVELVNDDLTQLKGMGAKLAEQFRELGFSEFAQIAALDLVDLEAPDHPLFNLRGRVERNEWIEQAKALVPPLSVQNDGK